MYRFMEYTLIKDCFYNNPLIINGKNPLEPLAILQTMNKYTNSSMYN